MIKVNDFYLPDEDTYFKAFFEKDNGFQLDHLKAILDEVTDFTVAIDGGAHVGSWSHLMSQSFSTVHAFEPAKDTYECLVKNLQEARRHCVIKTHNAALGNVTGLAKVINDTTRAGNTGSRYVNKVTRADDLRDAVDMLTVDCLCLNQLGLLKLDVEGFEYFAIQGAVKTIARCQPVVVIEKKSFKGRFEYDYKHAEELLIDLGMNYIRTVGNDAIYKFI